MSAATEKLLEHISLVREAITIAEDAGHDSTELKKELQYLNEKLASCSSALNENKSILKGLSCSTLIYLSLCLLTEKDQLPCSSTLVFRPLTCTLSLELLLHQ